jgi:hypothetical protein
MTNKLKNNHNERNKHIPPWAEQVQKQASSAEEVNSIKISPV